MPMEDLFTLRYHLLWTFALGTALMFPVRQLIWVLAVRRAERREGDSDEASRERLKRRATVTAAMLCFLFAYFYMGQLLTEAAK